MFASTRTFESSDLGGRSTGPLVMAALTAALLAVPSATAQADTLTDPDAVGDIVTFNEEDVAVPVPERTLNDVSSTKLAHGTRRVAIRLNYADLRRGGEVQAINISMTTNEGARRTVELVAYPKHWSGETEMYNGKWRDVSCNAVRHEIDYEGNVITVSFPRRCASNPRWVRFSVVAFAQEDDFYADDALDDDPISSQDDNDLAWSERIHRQAAS